jgi:hypothetical protein
VAELAEMLQTIAGSSIFVIFFGGLSGIAFWAGFHPRQCWESIFCRNIK